MNSFETTALELHNKIKSEIKDSIEQGNIMVSALLEECSLYKSIIAALSSAHQNSFNEFQQLPITQYQSPSIQDTIFLKKKHYEPSIEKSHCLQNINQTVKNRKIVYLHSDFHNPSNNKCATEPPVFIVNYLNSNNITTNNNNFNTNKSNDTNEDATVIKHKALNRGSIYRGVSKNGSQWQVLIMINKKKKYIGSYSNEELAAKAYDRVALRNHGKKAKTNFFYKEQEIEQILSGELHQI